MEEESSPEAPRPLVIRKKPSSAFSSSRLSVGLDAFQLKQTGHEGENKQVAVKRRPFEPKVMIRTPEDDERDWDEISNSRQMMWSRFCQEAVAELQKR